MCTKRNLYWIVQSLLRIENQIVSKTYNSCKKIVVINCYTKLIIAVFNTAHLKK